MTNGFFPLQPYSHAHGLLPHRHSRAPIMRAHAPPLEPRALLRDCAAVPSADLRLRRLMTCSPDNPREEPSGHTFMHKDCYLRAPASVTSYLISSDDRQSSKAVNGSCRRHSLARFAGHSGNTRSASVVYAWNDVVMSGNCNVQYQALVALLEMPRGLAEAAGPPVRLHPAMYCPYSTSEWTGTQSSVQSSPSLCRHRALSGPNDRTVRKPQLSHVPSTSPGEKDAESGPCSSVAVRG